MRMKAFQFAVFALVCMGAVAGAAEHTTLVTSTLVIGERPLWQKVVRGMARVVTFGAMQATADSVKQNQTFIFAFDHDGIDTDAYQVLINGAVHGSLPVNALENGSVYYAFQGGLPKGTYTLVAKAYGPGGEGDSDPLSLSVTAGNPSNPRNPRIVK